MHTVKRNIVEAIGSTPIVQLQSGLVPHGKALYLKLESFNPTFSIKDRTAFALVQAAMASGDLKQGGTLIESTSGNLGKSLAMLGAALGFNVVIVVDPKVSEHNLAVFNAFGAEVVMVNQPDASGGYQKARIRKVREMLQLHPRWYWPNQYDNPENPEFHYNHTAAELLESDCKFDTLVGTVSTGGHFCGVGRRIKESLPSVRIVACDAVGSAIFQNSFQPHLLNGIGLSWRTKNIDMSVFDAYAFVNDTEAFSLCRIIARTTGMLLGGSSGVALFCALNQLHTTNARSVLCINADTGWNYLEQFYDDGWLKAKGIQLEGYEDLLEKLMQPRANPVSRGAMASAGSDKYAVHV